MVAGRPLKYTKEEFYLKVKEYFFGAFVDSVETALNNIEWKKQRGRANIAGLLIHLDISRETWREYGEREEFVDTIKKARLRIEDEWVQRLDGAAATGAIFYLKNAFREDYADRQETDITSGGKPVAIYGGESTNNVYNNLIAEIKSCLTVENIDDYIRYHKRLGVKKMYWNKKDYTTLSFFVTRNGFSLKDDTFMGIKHYLDGGQSTD